MFQSLFYWTAESNEKLRKISDVIKTFQSLFYWTAESNSKAVALPSSHKGVSILVLLDSRIKHFPLTRTGIRRLRFQSLFYWTAESNYVEYAFHHNNHQCFNPCFIGQQNQTGFWLCLVVFSYSVSILVLLDSRIKLYDFDFAACLDYGFNPCFIGQQNQTIASCNVEIPSKSEFQSLFYWTAESNKRR